MELFAAVAACQHVNKTIVDLQSLCRWATLQHTRGRRVLLLTTNSVKLQRSAAAAAAGTRQRAPAGLMTSRPARYLSPKALYEHLTVTANDANHSCQSSTTSASLPNTVLRQIGLIEQMTYTAQFLVTDIIYNKNNVFRPSTILQLSIAVFI